jgi:magnesium chelatase accessory protein
LADGPHSNHFAAPPHGASGRRALQQWSACALSAAADGAPDSRLPADWPLRHLSRLVRSGGLDWHVQVAGEGPTILLLHGTGASAHSWSDVVSALGQQVSVVVPDLPGHGFTQGAAMRDLSLPVIARAIDRLLIDLEVGPVDLVAGHSSGAPLALRWALGQQQPPQWVVGFNPALVAPPAAYHQLVAPLLVPLVTSRPMASLFSTLGVSTGMVQRLLTSTNSKVSEQQRARYEVLFRRPSHVRGAMGLMAAADLPNLLFDLKALQSKQCFVLGTVDDWIPRRSLESVLARYAPAAEVDYWDGGHLLHEAEPERTAQFLLSRLNRP